MEEKSNEIKKLPYNTRIVKEATDNRSEIRALRLFEMEIRDYVEYYTQRRGNHLYELALPHGDKTIQQLDKEALWAIEATQ